MSSQNFVPTGIDFPDFPGLCELSLLKVALTVSSYELVVVPSQPTHI